MQKKLISELPGVCVVYRAGIGRPSQEFEIADITNLGNNKVEATLRCW